MTVIAEPIAAPPSAWRNPGYRAHFGTYVLAMMADNVEHVISYRMTFQKFQSPALGGFAVVSHWLPFLLFSVAVGGLADRVDPRRMIQSGMALYLPLLWWICKAPYGPQFRVGGTPAPTRPVKGLADIVQTAPEVASLPLILPMVLLAGTVAFFVGNSYHAQMPGFATDLGHGHADVTRSALLLAAAWAIVLAAFATTPRYAVALVLLFAAGLLELAFGSMAQTLVQLNAPAASRGRVIGLFNMAAMGSRTFSGITVGMAGSVMGIHTSLAVSAGLVVVVCGVLWTRLKSTG